MFISERTELTPHVQARLNQSTKQCLGLEVSPQSRKSVHVFCEYAHAGEGQGAKTIDTARKYGHCKSLDVK